jgi:hypothetical protein
VKYLYYTIFIIAIIFLFVFAGVVLGEEALSGILTVNLAEETAIYTESHDFSQSYGVKTTVHVEKSDCLKCLDWYYITDCQAKGECLDVEVY